MSLCHHSPQQLCAICEIVLWLTTDSLTCLMLHRTNSMQFGDFEAKDGVRFAWNVLPNTRLEATRLAVPVSCMYSPLKAVTGLATVQYPPIQCQNKAAECGAVLNPYCRVDFNNKIWICPFCMTRNHFPHHYADISTENRPAEIIPQYTTMGQYLPTSPPHHIPNRIPISISISHPPISISLRPISSLQ